MFVLPDGLADRAPHVPDAGSRVPQLQRAAHEFVLRLETPTRSAELIHRGCTYNWADFRNANPALGNPPWHNEANAMAVLDWYTPGCDYAVGYLAMTVAFTHTDAVGHDELYAYLIRIALKLESPFRIPPGSPRV